MDKMKVGEFIEQIKQELLGQKETEVPIFYIDEVTLEVNFVVSKEGEAKASFVAEVGGKYKKEDVHKAIIRMKPLLSREELLKKMSPKQKEEIEKTSRQAHLKSHQKQQFPEY